MDAIALFPRLRNFVWLTFRAERLRPAAQLLKNKLTDWRAEVRSSDELDGGYWLPKIRSYSS